jgi:hypothetical protein
MGYGDVGMGHGARSMEIRQKTVNAKIAFGHKGQRVVNSFRSNWLVREEI